MRPRTPSNPRFQQPNWFDMIKSTVTRMLFFYLMMSAVKTFFGQNNTSPSSNYTGGSSAGAYQPSTNLYQPNQPFDFFFYLSPNEHVFRDFDNADALVWSEKGGQT